MREFAPPSFHSEALSILDRPSEGKMAYINHFRQHFAFLHPQKYIFPLDAPQKSGTGTSVPLMISRKVVSASVEWC